MCQFPRISRLSNVFALLALGVGLSTTALAQEHDHSAQEPSSDVAANVSPEQATAMFSQLDANNDGMLNFEEFSSIPMPAFERGNAGNNGMSREQVLERRFEMIDTNNDGLISAAEMQAQRVHLAGLLQQRGQGQGRGAGGMRQGGGQGGGQSQMPAMTPEQREQMRARREQMTPEQQQQMRERMQQQRGQRPMMQQRGQQGQQNQRGQQNQQGHQDH